MIYIVMGVSGSGKSTVGARLAHAKSLPFYDADDFHPKTNLTKMASGIPLTDEDRKPWLSLLAVRVTEWESEGGAVLACSALKQTHRDILTSKITSLVKFIYLKGDQNLLTSRLRNRHSHFMPASLLISQLDTLEPPENAVTVDVDNSIDVIVSTILNKVK